MTKKHKLICRKMYSSLQSCITPAVLIANPTIPTSSIMGSFVYVRKHFQFYLLPPIYYRPILYQILHPLLIYPLHCIIYSSPYLSTNQSCQALASSNFCTCATTHFKLSAQIIYRHLDPINLLYWLLLYINTRHSSITVSIITY